MTVCAHENESQHCSARHFLLFTKEKTLKQDRCGLNLPPASHHMCLQAAVGEGTLGLRIQYIPCSASSLNSATRSHMSWISGMPGAGSCGCYDVHKALPTHTGPNKQYNGTLKRFICARCLSEYSRCLRRDICQWTANRTCPWLDALERANDWSSEAW